MKGGDYWSTVKRGEECVHVQESGNSVTIENGLCQGVSV